jgi:hypothetical protein
MKTQQISYASDHEDFKSIDLRFSFTPDLILIFGCSQTIRESELSKKLRNEYPDTIISGCSTAGEISGIQVNDGSVVCSAVKFDHTNIEFHSISLNENLDSLEAGAALMSKFNPAGLKHVFVLSDGLNVNGTALVQGIRSTLPKDVNVTGGLAGDGADFKSTWVIDKNGQAQSNLITAIGFYGEHIHIGYGSLGGWDSFGIERSVTKSEKNVLYEIDKQPALQLYKSFLGDQAKDLPASGLLFPLSIRTEILDEPLVRTILAVNEEEQSLTFAGDIPEGSFVKLMKANVDRLIEGAGGAAQVSVKPLDGKDVEFAILISCVGRKLVLKQLVEEEVEAVQDILGQQAVLTGFYSYGELAPFLKDAKCELHNQTMTITTFTEL